MEKDNIMIISIVAIVAIVGMVFMIGNFGGTQYVASENSYVNEGDLAGQAIRGVSKLPVKPIPTTSYAKVYTSNLWRDGIEINSSMSFYANSGDDACGSLRCTKIVVSSQVDQRKITTIPCDVFTKRYWNGTILNLPSDEYIKYSMGDMKDRIKFGETRFWNSDYKYSWINTSNSTNMNLSFASIMVEKISSNEKQIENIGLYSKPDSKYIWANVDNFFMTVLDYDEKGIYYQIGLYGDAQYTFEAVCSNEAVESIR